MICAEILGYQVDMRKYAVEITGADVCDGACSTSTLKEAPSWGKVDTTYGQMVFPEATSVLPLTTRYVYRQCLWQDRPPGCWSRIYRPVLAGERE